MDISINHFMYIIKKINIKDNIEVFHCVLLLWEWVAIPVISQTWFV